MRFLKQSYENFGIGERNYPFDSGLESCPTLRTPLLRRAQVVAAFRAQSELLALAAAACWTDTSFGVMSGVLLTFLGDQQRGRRLADQV